MAKEKLPRLSAPIWQIWIRTKRPFLVLDANKKTAIWSYVVRVTHGRRWRLRVRSFTAVIVDPYDVFWGHFPRVVNKDRLIVPSDAQLAHFSACKLTGEWERLSL